MSRFTPTRWNQILVWSGASLVWGTAFVAAKAEPDRAQDEPPAPAEEQLATTGAALPQAPPSGLTIIRYTPIEVPAAEVQRVYVQAAKPAVSGPTSSPTSSVAASAPPAAALAPAPAPNPPSSGS